MGNNKIQKKELNRIEWIDMAKGIGIICVIIGHITHNSFLGMWVYSFHLPLFLFISGYLFNPKANLREFSKSRFKQCIIPYVTLGTLVVIFNILRPLDDSYIYGWEKPDIKGIALDHIKRYLLQERYATLWYLSVLLGVSYVIYLVYILGGYKSPRNILMSSIFILVFCVLNKCYYDIIGRPLIWNVDAIFMAAPFFHMGYLFRITSWSKLFFDGLHKKVWRYLILTSLFLISISLLMINYKLTGYGLEMYDNRYGIPVITYICALVGVLLILGVSFCHQWKFIRYIGRNSIVFYLLHQAMLIPTVERINRRINYEKIAIPASLADTIILCLEVIGVLVIMYIVNEIIKRVKRYIDI